MLATFLRAECQKHFDERKKAVADLKTPADVEKFTYAASLVDAVYPGDYTGLPEST